jgi:xylulokinase
VGGVGIGAVDDGQGFISLGTSAQIFVAATSHDPDPDRMVHAFCHALPDRWYRMAALLNGASPLAAVARWTRQADIEALLGEVEAGFEGPSDLLALPYLFGERTPHNDPHARGAIIGMTGSTRTIDVVQAVMEGVAFSLADGFDVLSAAGTQIGHLGFIGGGARSAFWGRIIASVLGVTLIRFDAADRGPAFGAARLARLCATGESPSTVVVAPPVEIVIEPDERLHALYRPRVTAFRSLYTALRPIFTQQDAGAET